MSLNTYPLSEVVEDAYVKFIKFDIDTKTSELNDKGEYVPPTSEERWQWANDFADAYHVYANKGVINGAVSGGGDKKLLRDAMFAVPSGGVDGTEGIALAMIEYWSQYGISSGYPAHGGVAWVSTVNNVSSLLAAMISTIRLHIRLN